LADIKFKRKRLKRNRLKRKRFWIKKDAI